MLTKRQYDILKFFIENKSEFISSSKLAEAFSLSSRTIKNELPHIRKATSYFSSLNFETVPGKGSKIEVMDNALLISELSDISKKYSEHESYNETYLSVLILDYLMNEKRYISREAILNKFYISESSFYKVYGDIKSILATFKLEITHSKALGYRIQGSEKNKRNLIAKYDLISKHDSKTKQTQDIVNVYDFVADTFINYQYSINESILQNISSHIVLMDYRVKFGNYIDSIDDYSTSDCTVYKISKKICNEFLAKYFLPNDIFEHEVLLLCQTILGKVSYSADKKTQTKINNFINDCFAKINYKFNINFEPVEKIRLHLALHMISLIHRINSSTQLKNVMATEIRQQFPLANDIALYFSLLFTKEFDLKISPDELSYITLYFNFGIEELNLTTSTKEILIITNHRNSETVLLRHKIITWFPNQILKIQFVHPDNPMPAFESFDAILATDLYSMRYSNAVTLVNLFPDEADFRRVNLAINGYTDTESILEKFSEDCFFSGSVKNKNQLLEIVCDKAINKFSLDESFHEKIVEREKIASTYFGNAVAIPHPLAPISDETFVSVAVLEEPIKWDDQHDVSLVFLISIERNNPKAFQFWYYMSDIVRSNDHIEKLLKQKDFTSFVNELKTMFDKFV